MGKYAVFLLFLVYGCYVHKKPKPIPEEPVSWNVKVKEVGLHSYTNDFGKAWIESYPSHSEVFPGTDSVLIDFFFFPYWERFRYKCYVHQNYDSIVLGPIRFTARSGMILSRELTAPGYRLTIDNPPRFKYYSGDYATKELFDNFYGTPVREDFFRDNGSLHQSIIKNRYGEDSVWLSWYPDGSIQARKDPERIDYYFQNGINLSICDTMLKGRNYLTCARYFYANGNMQRQEFYEYRTPVHNWTYYNENGKLIKSINYKKLRYIEYEDVLEELSYPSLYIDTTFNNMNEWEHSIRKSLSDSLVNYLNKSWEMVKPGIYTFRLSFSYYRKLLAVEVIACPTDNPGYIHWIKEQIQMTITTAKSRQPLQLGSYRVEPTFLITLEISPKQIKPQN